VLNFYKWQKHGSTEKKYEHAQNRYRLMWMDVKYEPGTVKCGGFDNGKAVAEQECILLASLTK
jgi:beta-galactosidase